MSGASMLTSHADSRYALAQKSKTLRTAIAICHQGLNIIYTSLLPKDTQSMCLSESTEHVCVSNCPLCFSFTEANIASLLGGELVMLGKLDDLVQSSKVGCQFCQLVLRQFLYTLRGIVGIQSDTTGLRVNRSLGIKSGSKRVHERGICSGQAKPPTTSNRV